MIPKLALDSLKAELNSAQDLFESAQAVGDIIGELQFKSKIETLRAEIEKVSSQAEHNAKLALFFGGQPVLGSYGVNASFAGPILERFQDVVTKIHAYLELGQLGSRGKIALQSWSDLMVTDLAKGSFGFVLEEAGQQELTDSALKESVELVADMLQKCGLDDEDAFENVIDDIDGRVLDSLKHFFVTLDKNQANVRLVENQRDFTLDRNAVSRARRRIESTELDENVDHIAINLTGFLPEHRRFEARLDDGSDIHGSATREAAKQFEAFSAEHKMLMQKWEVAIQKRVFRARNHEPRVSYQLIEFVPPKS